MMYIKSVENLYKKYNGKTLVDGIYEVTTQGGSKWYEVFKERVVKDMSYDKQNCKFINSSENGHIAYPSDECFGSWAWNVISIEYAEDIIKKKS